MADAFQRERHHLSLRRDCFVAENQRNMIAISSNIRHSSIFGARSRNAFKIPYSHV